MLKYVYSPLKKKLRIFSEKGLELRSLCKWNEKYILPVFFNMWNLSLLKM